MASFVSWVVLAVLGLVCLGLGRHWRRRGERLLAYADARQRTLDVFIADRQVSAFCCKSIVYRLGPTARCECFACRRERGEPVTEATQEAAGMVQQSAMQADLAAWEGEGFEC